MIPTLVRYWQISLGIGVASAILVGIAFAPRIRIWLSLEGHWRRFVALPVMLVLFLAALFGMFNGVLGMGSRAETRDAEITGFAEAMGEFPEETVLRVQGLPAPRTIVRKSHHELNQWIRVEILFGPPNDSVMAILGEVQD